MRGHRRDFLRVSSIAAAGAAMACGGGTPAPAARVGTASFSVLLQFSGLMVHGAWPATSQWDALLIRDGHHVPQLRIPLKNVPNASGFTLDRYTPGMGIWNIKDMDVVVKLNGNARGKVTEVLGKRPKDQNGTLVPCPNRGNDDEFLDMTWLADLKSILGNGTLKDALKADSAGIEQGKLLAARVRLPEGVIACARPSLADYELVKFAFASISAYAAQFNADLIRLTSTASPKITIEMIPFGGSTPTRAIEVVPSAGESNVVVHVEHHDPILAQRVLVGEITEATFWKHHFAPCYDLLRDGQTLPTTEPKPECCGSCDPPFYCFPERGYFA